MHTKRTGHSDFADKTAETAKPIVLENKSVAGSSGSGVGASAENAAGSCCIIYTLSHNYFLWSLLFPLHINSHIHMKCLNSLNQG